MPYEIYQTRKTSGPRLCLTIQIKRDYQDGDRINVLEDLRTSILDKRSRH
jgi:hypothetical protein